MAPPEPPPCETESLDDEGLPSVVVGVGASAGGLDALKRLFTGVKDDLRACWVVVQHLDPTHKSLMVELLSRHAHIPIELASDGQALRPNRAYMVAPGTQLLVGSERLTVKPVDDPLRALRPITELFRSIADSWGPRGAAVVLSGTGSDGAAGAADVASSGGLVIAQSPSEAQFDGMPRAAISTGLVDVVVPASYVPMILAARAHRRDGGGPSALAGDAESVERVERAASDRPLEQLVRDRVGVELSHYKAEGIERRFHQRVERTQAASAEAYLAEAAVNPAEQQALADSLFINVTSFFRDPEVWGRLRERVLPKLVRAAQEAGRPVRAWSAGTSLGQEAYAIAMLLHQTYLDAGLEPQYRVFATDINPRALETASRGLYSEPAVADVPPALRERYFDRDRDQWKIRPEVRNQVLFTLHDVISDPPFHNLDLAVCRNLLIYLREEVQARVLSRLIYGLRTGGVLALGAAEHIGEQRGLLEPLDRKARLYEKVGELAPAQRHEALVTRFRRRAAPIEVTPTRGIGPRQRTLVSSLYDSLAREIGVVVLAVDGHHQLRYSIGAATPYLRVPTGDFSNHLDALLVEPLSALCRVALRRAEESGERGYAGMVRLGDRVVRVEARSLPSDPEVTGLVLLREVTAHSADDHVPSLETLHTDEEAVVGLRYDLESAQESLRSAIEELEASNEELQASNEELIASNEAYQSSAEELQSLNEELHTINAEHQDKIQQLQVANTELDTLLDAVDVGIVFLDEERRLRRFNRRAAGELHLVPRDIGRLLCHVEPAGALSLDALVVESAQRDAPVECADPVRGRVFRCRPFQYPGSKAPGLLLSLVDISASGLAEGDLQAILNALPHAVAVADPRGVIARVNVEWTRWAQSRAGDPTLLGPGSSYADVVRSTFSAEEDARRALQLGDQVMARSRSSFELHYSRPHEDSSRAYTLWVAAAEEPAGGIVISHVPYAIAAGRA